MEMGEIWRVEEDAEKHYNNDVTEASETRNL